MNNQRYARRGTFTDISEKPGGGSSRNQSAKRSHPRPDHPPFARSERFPSVQSAVRPIDRPIVSSPLQKRKKIAERKGRTGNPRIGLFKKKKFVSDPALHATRDIRREIYSEATDKGALFFPLLPLFFSLTRSATPWRQVSTRRVERYFSSRLLHVSCEGNFFREFLPKLCDSFPANRPSRGRVGTKWKGEKEQRKGRGRKKRTNR